jgi:hypothetical protein
LVAACGGASDSSTGGGSQDCGFSDGTIICDPNVPGSVTSITVVASNSQISLSWLAPESNGGPPARWYEIEVYLDSPEADRSEFWEDDWWIDRNIKDKTAVVSGLKGGVRYFFRIYAVNFAGRGPESLVSGLPGPDVVKSEVTKRVTTTSGESGLVRSLSRETSCEVLDAEWFTADALADLARETFGRSSENYQVAKTYKSAISNRMDQLGC